MCNFSPLQTTTHLMLKKQKHLEKLLICFQSEWQKIDNTVTSVLAEARRPDSSITWLFPTVQENHNNTSKYRNSFDILQAIVIHEKIDLMIVNRKLHPVAGYLN